MSSSSSPTQGNFNFRSKSFWLLCLFLIYSLFGWLVVPKIVETQLTDNLKTLANWDTKVDSIVFNPYTLSLQVNHADIQDKQTQSMIRFDELFINFSLLETLSGTISFDEISLDDPFVYLHVDQHGMTNFQHTFSSGSDQDEPATEESSGEMIGIFFDLIAISSGKISLSDDSQGENFQLDLEPLNLSLESFSTDNNEGGDYALSISLGNDQQINWHGQLGIAPFSSTGHLELKNIDSTSFWHYAKAASPYWLNKARITLSGDYHTTVSADSTQFRIENTALLIQNAVLTETNNGESLLDFKRLNIAPISFDLSKLTLDLGKIELDQPNISIERSNDASLNILRPLAAQNEAESKSAPVSESSKALEPTKTDNTEPKSKAFHWNISGVNVHEGTINWQDASLSTPAKLNVGSLNLSLGGMSDDLSQAFPYALSFAYMPAQNSEKNIADQKQVIKGSVSPSPFTLKGTAELTDIPLASFQNYLSEASNVAVSEGLFNLQSEYNLAMLASENENSMQGDILTTLSINQLALTDIALNKPLSGFKNLSVGPVNVAFLNEPDTQTDINIESIILDQPYGDIFISKEGQINLSHLSKNNSENAATNTIKSEQVSETRTSDNEAKNALAFLLKHFEIKKGQFTYTDASLTPTFTTQLSALNGSINNISSKDDIKSSVSFDGKIDAHGNLAVKGTLNPLSTIPNTDINVLASNIDLTMASPYSAKYAGYQIEKGKLNLDLSYLIDDTKLKANNQVLLKQFQFGKSVDSPEATNLPLPLAIGILKNRKGEIDIDLPISGDLSDPSFKLSSVVLNTFVNLITKVVTSPFSILGGLIEGSDDISEVQFMANSAALTSDQLERISTLAAALKERPNLTLEIRGIANANIDKQDTTMLSEPELIQLAKDRAQTMNQAIIEQGNIEADRVFILEPKVVALSEKTETPKKPSESQGSPSPATISSKFTLGVR